MSEYRYFIATGYLTDCQIPELEAELECFAHLKQLASEASLMLNARIRIYPASMDGAEKPDCIYNAFQVAKSRAREFKDMHDWMLSRWQSLCPSIPLTIDISED